MEHGDEDGDLEGFLADATFLNAEEADELPTEEVADVTETEAVSDS